jgi:hypothetical protein
MSTTNHNIVVADGATPQAKQVHHHDFAEIRAEGESVKDAARHLINKLKLAMDTALTDWRREGLTKAIQEVEEFFKSQK